MKKEPKGRVSSNERNDRGIRFLGVNIANKWGKKGGVPRGPIKHFGEDLRIKGERLNIGGKGKRGEGTDGGERRRDKNHGAPVMKKRGRRSLRFNARGRTFLGETCEPENGHHERGRGIR